MQSKASATAPPSRTRGSRPQQGPAGSPGRRCARGGGRCPASASACRKPISPDDFEPAHRVQLDGGVLLFGRVPGLPQRLRRSPACPRSAACLRTGMASTRSGRIPIARAIMTDPRDTRSLWPRVSKSLVCHGLAEHRPCGLVGALLVRAGELGNGPARHERRDQRPGWAAEQPEQTRHNAAMSRPKTAYPSLRAAKAEVERLRRPVAAGGPGPLVEPQDASCSPSPSLAIVVGHPRPP